MQPRERTLAKSGVGPLLQRDYWAEIKDCRLTPSQVGSFLAEHFCELAPPELVEFHRTDERADPLTVGDELDIHIRFTGHCGVRVIHADDHSITLGTLRGHPEAGRITFGAYRSKDGGVIFHIRSRARASTRSRYTGFVAVGEPMQTKTWTDFVERVAGLLGAGVRDFVYEESAECADEADEECPTFVAEGD